LLATYWICRQVLRGIGQGTQDIGPRTEDPGQRTQDRGPRTEDPLQRTQDRGPRTEDPGQRTEDPTRRTEDRGSRTQNRGLGSIGLTTSNYWRPRTVD